MHAKGHGVTAMLFPTNDECHRRRHACQNGVNHMQANQLTVLTKHAK